MSKAVDTARQVAACYFAQRGENPAEDRARSFLSRITLRTNGAWRSDTLVETAVEIINSATINVDQLVENDLHIKLGIEPLHEYDRLAGSPVFGLAFPRKREIIICERAERYAPLYRTSVAHELGHVLLHGTAARSRLSYAPSSRNRPPEEYEADEFMIALLAPANVLRLGTALAAHERGLHIWEVCHRANSSRGRWQWREKILPCLIDRMCLSRLLLSIQMRQLGVFTDATVEYHRSYALPNRWRTSVTPRA